MARKPQKGQFERIYRAVEENPGKRSGLVAHILGLPRSQVSRSPPAMNDHGYLLSEDDKGRL